MEPEKMETNNINLNKPDKSDEPNEIHNETESIDLVSNTVKISQKLVEETMSVTNEKNVDNLDGPQSESITEDAESLEIDKIDSVSNNSKKQEISMEVDEEDVEKNLNDTLPLSENSDKLSQENECTEDEDIETNENIEQISDNKESDPKTKEACSDKLNECEKLISNEENKKKKKSLKENLQASNESLENEENVNIENVNEEKEKEIEENETEGKEKEIEENETEENENKTNDDEETTAKESSSNFLNRNSECESIEIETEKNKKVESKISNEVKNTEFVQLNQEKEDSQSSFTRSENQPELEDPFAGDNLSVHTASIESMEVDSDKILESPKAHEEPSSSINLDDSEKTEKDKTGTNTDKEVEKNQEKTINNESDVQNQKEMEMPEATKVSSCLSETLSEAPSETPSDTSSDKPLQIALESSPEKTGVISPEKLRETSKEAESDILPGQDDELCIIPDNTKEKVVKDSCTETISQQDEDEENIENPEADDKTKKSNKETDKEKTTENVLKVATDLSNLVTVRKSPETPAILTSDVIDLEDDSKNPEIEEIGTKEICKQCHSEKPCPVKVKIGTKNYKVCSDACKTIFVNENNKALDIPSEGVNSKREKRCAHCLLIVEPKDERNLSWETMEFCNEECLGKFQTKYGSFCRNCNGAVQSVSLGKYCVRFGYDVRQFCCSTCLEEFKKGLKVCSYCQKDISAGTEGFLAPVGDKGQFKDFCTQDCMEKYSKMNSTEPPAPEKKVCSVCQEEKVMYCEVQIDRPNPPVPICSEPCFAAFKFVNKVDPDQCNTCKKYFQLPAKRGFVVFYEDEAHIFCNKTCLNVFIIQNRKIVPCNWCKVKKYNFDMIKKELKTGQVMMMCSLNCLTLYQVSINAVSARRINCDFCKEFSQAQYHLTMSDATIRNFCSYNCVMKFQAKYTKSPITIPTTETGSTASTDPVPTGIPKRAVIPPSTGVPQSSRTIVSQDTVTKKTLPVISSVTSLAAMANGQQSTVQIGTSQTTIGGTLQPITLVKGTTPVTFKQQIITRPVSPVSQGNKMTQCKPLTHTKGVSVRPILCHRETQTEVEDKLIVPLPVPIFIPFPVHMYSMPFPVPVPIPIPIPVPVFIPTTRNSAKGIFKEIKRIQEKIPSDPFEAELLMMAEMVATEKKNESDSESDDTTRDEGDENDSAANESYSPEAVDNTNAFGEDMLQMALKMATGEMDDPAVDLETALTPSTIQTPQKAAQDENAENDAPQGKTQSLRGKKRGPSSKFRTMHHKRPRRPITANTLLSSAENQNTIQNRFDSGEKPDANMALKYTFGVNAWRQWVIIKNAELEKQSTPTRKLKLFKTDLLQLTADELNYSLCLFVKEVRKPSGAEYAPDTIYYLCLGIQQYLFENNRIDNIFTDSYYEKFTDCLNEVANRFSTVFNDALYVVTRVEEEHLWECKQLGAHSPHVLLNTLMYFNTKHFNLVTVDEHMQLSFSHIMKHWKRNPSAGLTANSKGPGSRNILLRFYPPQSALEANSKKKKVYEQQENEENPLRCPVKLYEFYLSKCPESVKTRNDVFYLLPERSCVPDSPVWYSTSPLAKEHLVKMLHRIKMVKEVNVAFISS